MDNAIIAYYRKLTGTGFKNSGSLEEPSILLKNFVDFSPSCHGNTDDFMHIYLNVADNIISEIKYQCICDPTANVAVEILCNLVKGKNLEEVAVITEQEFSKFLGSHDEGFEQTAKDLLDLLNGGINNYTKTKVSSPG